MTSITLQHMMVIALVAGCVGFVAWHAVRSLAGKRSRVGSCCAKGCGERSADDALLAKPQEATRDQFMPVEALKRPR